MNIFVITLIVGLVAGLAAIVIRGLFKATTVALVLFGATGWIVLQLPVADQQQASGVVGLGVGGVIGAIIGGFLKSKKAG